MGHCFSHLTKADRYKIEALLNNGHSAKEIAAEIHVHISTIYREVKRARMVHRNSDWTEEERYNPDEAHRRYRENLSAKGAPLKIGRDYALAEYLERKVLEEGRSPAAALADIALEGLEFKTTICTSTFYGYITKGVFLMLTNKDLPEKAKRKRKYRKVKTAKRAPRGKSIEKRPAEVEGREVFRTLGNGYRLQREADFKESPSCADGAEDATRNYRAYAGSDGGKHHKGT